MRSHAPISLCPFDIVATAEERNVKSINSTTEGPRHRPNRLKSDDLPISVGATVKMSWMKYSSQAYSSSSSVADDSDDYLLEILPEGPIVAPESLFRTGFQPEHVSRSGAKGWTAAYCLPPTAFVSIIL